MRALLIFITAIVVIILGLWATLVLYFDEARLKQIATEQVRAQTGRELVIDGPLKLDFFPGVSLVASDVSLSGPDNYSGPDFFKADEFRMSLSLLPLLSGTVETGDVGLDRAELNLHTDGAGISSLDGLVSGEADADAGQTDVSTGEILLSDIRLNVTDVATDSRQVFVIERLRIDSFRYDQPVAFEFQGSLGDPPSIEDIDLNGEVLVPSGSGPVRISGMELDADVSGLALALSGNAEVQPGPPMVAQFSNGRIRLGDSEFTTAFSYRDGQRPKVEATLQGGMLDVDALLASMPAAPEQQPEAGDGSVSAVPAESPLLLLRDLDLDAQMNLEAMKISGLNLNSIRTRVVAENGLVTIDPLSGALAGGRVDAVGRVDLNAQPPTVQLAPVFDLESLSDALAPWGMDRFVTGSGVLDLSLDARGLDVRSILGSLDGSGAYDFRDGSIKGFDFSGMVQGLSTRNIAEAARAGVGGTTAFKTMQGALAIEDGTIRLPGMQIVTEALGINGDVRVNLGDLGLGGRLRLEGERLERIPIALEGTLLKPRLVPDVGEALKDEAGRRVMDFLKERSGDKEDNGG